MSEWKPAETAPLEMPVLIWDGKMQAVARRREEKWGRPWTCEGAFGYEWENDFEAPTHWMPFPPPPT